MSDFSELCPLFSTGVYSELTIGEVTFSGLSATNNALVGAKAKASFPGSLKFQRTVVVTKIFAQKMGAVGTLVYLIANHHKSTGTAAGTAFASIKCSATDSLIPVGAIRAMTQAANKTFLAADVLGFSPLTSVTDPGKWGFIVRYKEK
jgi:hypothetical protein